MLIASYKCLTFNTANSNELTRALNNVIYISSNNSGKICDIFLHKDVKLDFNGKREPVAIKNIRRHRKYAKAVYRYSMRLLNADPIVLVLTMLTSSYGGSRLSRLTCRFSMDSYKSSA